MTDQPEAPDPNDPYGRTPAERAALRRRQLVIGWVLGGIVVLGVVAAVVFSVLLNRPSTDPTSPEQAAQKWATAVLHRDTGGQRHLECVGKHSAADVLRLVTATSADVRAGVAQPDGDHRWQVPVTVDGTTVTVGVEEQGDRYLVC